MSGGFCKACGSPAPVIPPGEAPSPRHHRLPLRGLSGSKEKIHWKLIGFSLLGAFVVMGSIMWFVWESTDAKMKKQGQFDDEVVIPPGKSFGYLLIVGPLDSHYSFEVTPSNGRAIMAFGRVDDGDTERPLAKDLESVMDHEVEVEAGKTKMQHGLMTRGRYSWVVVNPGDKPLRVKIRFG